LLTLSIAVFGFVALDLQERWFSPEVNLVMPPEARLLQKQRSGGEYLVRVYLQPAFASTGRSQRVEVLKSFHLFMEREGQQQCKRLRLDGLGSFTNNPDGAGLAFIYESGASPLMVTYDTPQVKVLVFELEEKMKDPYIVGKHHYLMTLVAERATEGKPLVGTIRVLADQDTLKTRAEELEGQPERNMFVNSVAMTAGTPDNCPPFE
jgi:hypothetical protein